jgi:hypothetical protein
MEERLPAQFAIFTAIAIAIERLFHGGKSPIEGEAIATIKRILSIKEVGIAMKMIKGGKLLMASIPKVVSGIARIAH